MRIEFGPELPGRAGGGQIPSRAEVPRKRSYV